jgi:poly(ribitol-phosphate) beta-N-acetylglucosaminyltransferase
MAIDVSVVIPVFNPGPNIDDCLSSLVHQTLPPDRYELVVVDDGSTDGTSARLDDWQRRHPELLRVEHIENSGWPSRPRNIGIGLAAGRYVQFVDNDDSMTPEALARLVEAADEGSADIVIGRFCSNFRGLKHSLFRENRSGVTLADFPLEDSLTPHKLFRRDFLDSHGLRFVEGIRNVEDQIFCMQAYVHAAAVSVLADTLCYRYVRRRGPGSNAGTRVIDPQAYYDALELVFDVIDAHVDSAELRARIYRRFYRNELLGRLRESAMLAYDDPYREQLLDRIADVAARRLPHDLHATTPAFVRVQSRLVGERDVPGLLDYSERLLELSLSARCDERSWSQEGLSLQVEAQLMLGKQPLRLEHDAAGWLLPRELAPSVAADDRRLRHPLGDPDVEVAVVSRSDRDSWTVASGLPLSIDPDGRVRIRATVGIDPTTAMGGSPLTAGIWDVRLRVGFAGFTRSAPLVATGDGEPVGSGWCAATGSVQAYWTEATLTLALDVDEWLHALPTHVATAAGEPAHVSAGVRSLTVEVPTLLGSGQTREGLAVLVPPDPAAPTVTRRAVLSVGSTGSRLDVRLPIRLAGGSATGTRPQPWRVWVALAEPGAGEPVELPLIVHPSAAGLVKRVEPLPPGGRAGRQPPSPGTMSASA